MKKFYNGQPVICINDDFKKVRKQYARVSPRLPVKGKRYTVRCYVIEDKHPCVVLREISNSNVLYSDGMFRELGFWDRRFEPVTDISKLEKLQSSKRVTIKKDRNEQVRRRRQKEGAE
jgi:hypothetical protein